MLLRTRLTLMVAVGLVLMAAGLGGAGLVREQLLLQRLSSTMLAAQATQWQQALATQQRELDHLGDTLVQARGFVQAARQTDSVAMNQTLAQAGQPMGAAGAGLELLALLRPGQNPLVMGPRTERALLDSESLERAFAGEAVSGLRLVGGGRALVLNARLLPEQVRPTVLVLARDSDQTLTDLARQTGAAATLVDLRGRALASTDPVLWQAAAPHVALRAAQQRELSLGEHAYSAVSLPVRDLAGHAIGTVVTLADHTSEARASRFLGLLALGGVGVLLLAILLGLNLYLRLRLRPLERAIDALQALAQGDTEVHLPHGGSDEIGRIASAVTSFRGTVKELLATRALRERVRRRQERLLHNRLQQLADATHQSLSLPSSHDDQEQLRHLAEIMDELTGRLIDQHRRLSGMVQELRETLILKDRLAGLEQELQIAAQVQMSILPTQPPQDTRIELHCHITPAREVGGDFYDYFFVDRQHLGFVIADVSGKGVPAALFMTITRTLLKAIAQFVAEPTQCIGQLNQLLAAENEQMMFVTLFYGVIDLESGHVDYVNAGHNPSFLLQADGSVTPLTRTGGVAVAVMEDLSYDSARITLTPGDQIFLYTDGVTEAFDIDGNEYGAPRLQRRLAQLLQAPEPDPATIGTGVVADVHAFERGAAQADDITCMTLRYRGRA